MTDQSTPTTPADIRETARARAAEEPKQLTPDPAAQSRYLAGKLSEAQSEAAQYFGAVQDLINQINDLEAKVAAADELNAALSSVNEQLVAKLQLPGVTELVNEIMEEDAALAQVDEDLALQEAEAAALSAPEDEPLEE